MLECCIFGRCQLRPLRAYRWCTVRRFLFVIPLLSLASIHIASCQDISSLRAGEPIRINLGASTAQRVQGRLISVSPDTIVLRTLTTSRVIRMSDVSLLEVKRRNGTSFIKSVAFGLLGGVIGGAVILGATGRTDTGDGIITAGDKVLIGAVVGGAAGLIGGTVFGVCCSSQWQPVPLLHGAALNHGASRNIGYRTWVTRTHKTRHRERPRSVRPPGGRPTHMLG
jgi:hypothetical protein